MKLIRGVWKKKLNCDSSTANVFETRFRRRTFHKPNPIRSKADLNNFNNFILFLSFYLKRPAELIQTPFLILDERNAKGEQCCLTYTVKFRK